MVCEREGVTKLCVTKLCVKDGGVKDSVCEIGVSKMVCERWWVTKWYVKDSVSKWCVPEVEEAAEEEEEAGYRIKNKNPTQRCGKKIKYLYL